MQVVANRTKSKAFLSAHFIVYVDIPGDISCNSLGLDLLIAVGSAAMFSSVNPMHQHKAGIMCRLCLCY